MTLLQVDGLGKRYHLGTRQRRELWALRGISFSLDRGSILGVIGPNGAGKTTLLKVLARITPPTEGRAVGRGRVVPLLALGSGFQADLTGRENVFLNAAMYGVSRREAIARFDDIVEFAGLGDFLDVPVRRYSSGMFLRLAFSVAINMEPDILLADEVLAVGDLEFQERCLERVQRAGRSGLGVLFVSHDMAAISRLCNMVLWLNAGEIVRFGKPDDVVPEYQESAWKAITRRSRKTVSHANDLAEILFVKLLSADGREIGATRTSDSVLIQVGLRILAPAVTFRCVVDLFAKGTAVFRSTQPDDRIAHGPGVYAIAARLPENLLTETIYSCNVIVKVASAAAGIETSLTWYNALAFPAYGLAARAHTPSTGVVAPLIDWHVVRHEPSAKLAT